MSDAPAKSFVLWSTPESIKAGTVSLLAVVEVIASVIVFWMLYHWLGTYWPLLISLFAAPFILLRSDEGTEMAVRMWWRWEDAPYEGYWYGWWDEAVIFLSAALSGSIAYGVSITWFIYYSDWMLFALGAFLSIIAMSITIEGSLSEASIKVGAVIIGFAAAGVGAEAVAGALLVAVAGVGTKALGEAVLIFKISVVVGAALAGIIALTAPVAAAPVGVTIMAWILGAVIFGVSAGALTTAGSAVGVWTAALWMRLIGTIWHLRAGLAQASANWRRLMWTEDAAHLPELIPGAGGAVPNVVDAWREGDNFIESAIYKLMALIWLAPALAWRYSFKATIWFYWPLMYAASAGKLANLEERRIWLETAPLIRVVGFVIACVSLGFAGTALFDHVAAANVLGAFRAEGAALSPAAAFVVVDWSRLLDYPWHIPNLVAASCAFIVFLAMDYHRRCRKVDPAHDLNALQIRALVYLSRVQFAAFVIYIAVGLYFVLAYINTCANPPSWIIGPSLSPESCPAPAAL